ncbi:uncharacterized protein LTHEOB_10323 [Neofusicoccum parvum]|uniref:Uncharacterized protein LTHEOB_10323 n=1 Tax=Neofusicoccum parvum TaxID=310453 RepID=A0ACB5RTN0_9PEZI|nr:uncharacterized protein LTHEOB_10323 [Neofusicoccum parvum]
MSFQHPLNILIFGTGAVGSTLGWRLAQNADVRLTAVCRSNYEPVKQHGIHLTTEMWGNGKYMPYRVVRSTREVSDVTFDYVVCANKVTSSDGLSFIKELAPVVSAMTVLVSAQNGVGVEEPLRLAFRNNIILSAVCYISCLQPLPGIIQQVSNLRPHGFHIGMYHPAEHGNLISKAKLENFVGLDNKFKQISDVAAERWIKQIFNGAWNPMAAISGLETHQLLDTPYLQMVRHLANEMYDVAVRLGISLSGNVPVETIECARNNPSLVPSMLQDARQKRPMEVETLCGSICRQADQIGVPVPTVKLFKGKISSTVEAVWHRGWGLEQRSIPLLAEAPFIRV